MNFVQRAEVIPPEDIRLTLRLLCDALDILTRGAFLFAVCEPGPLRFRLMQEVLEHIEAQTGRRPLEVVLSPEKPDLASQLEEHFLYNLPAEGTGVVLFDSALRERLSPGIVFVNMAENLADAGLAADDFAPDHPYRIRSERARLALRALNLQRERLSRLNVILVFWLSQSVLAQLTQYAADLFAARSHIFYFEYLVREPGAPPAMHPEAIVTLLDRFHRTLLPPEELRRRAVLYEQRLERERTVAQPNWAGIASLCQHLTDIYRELDNYIQAGMFQDQAIEAYQRAIAEQEQVGNIGESWATLQVQLGLAYYSCLRGERAENLEHAIEHYELALQVYTHQAFPEQWAMTQNNLGNAYLYRIRGERAENLEQAIFHYRQALEVYTRQLNPERWVAIHNNLANAYRNRIRGDHAENIERAVFHYQQAIVTAREIGDKNSYSNISLELGKLYIEQGRWYDALHLFEESLAIHRDG